MFAVCKSILVKIWWSVDRVAQFKPQNSRSLTELNEPSTGRLALRNCIIPIANSYRASVRPLHSNVQSNVLISVISFFHIYVPTGFMYGTSWVYPSLTGIRYNTVVLNSIPATRFPTGNPSNGQLRRQPRTWLSFPVPYLCICEPARQHQRLLDPACQITSAPIRLPACACSGCAYRYSLSSA